MGLDTKPNFSSNKFEQCTNDTMNLSGCTQIFGKFDMESGSTLTICDNRGVGKVLTSSASGVATWEPISNDALMVYYVDGNNDVTGDGSVVNPYQTVDLAVDAVIGSGSHASPENAGTTIFVQGGAYTTACNLAITCTSWSFEAGSCVTYTGTDYLFQSTGMSDASGTNFLKVSGKGEFFTASGGILSAIGTDYAQGAGRVRIICFEGNRIYSTYANYSNPLVKPIVYVAGGTSASGWNSLTTGLVLEVSSVAGYSQTPFHSDYHAYFAVCNTNFGLGSSAQSAVSVDGRLIDIDGVYAGRFENVGLSAYDVDYLVELGISGTTLCAASLNLCNISYSTTKAVSGRRPDKLMAISPLALETSQSFAPDISDFSLSNIAGTSTWFTDCTQSIDYNGNGTYPELHTLRIQNVQTPYGIDACIKPNICNQVNGIDTCVYSGGTYNVFGERLTLSNIRDCSGSENALYIGTDGEVLQGAASGGGSAASGENVTIEVTQATHGFALNDFLGWSGGTYNKAIADGLYDGEFVGLVTEVPDGNTFKVTQSGYVTGLTASFVANTTYWLSEGTAGLLTSTEPTGDGEISKAAFVADTTSSGWVLPYAGVVVSTGATTLSGADNGLTDNGGIVGLGGTLCQNTDIDVSGYNLSISGLSGKTTQTNVVFIDDATGTLITGATSGGIYDGLSPAAIEVGGILVDTVLTGKTYTELFEELLVPELCGTVTNPSVGRSLSATGLYEIGCSLSQTITATFNPGCIDPQYDSLCDKRSAGPNAYCFVGTGATSGFQACVSCTAQDIGTSFNVGIGTTSWSVCTRYDAGFPALSNKGIEFCAALVSGCTTSTNASICGVYPLWATCDNITVPLEKIAVLYNMPTATNICLVLVDETPTDKQKFEVPCAWLGAPTSKPLTGVCLWNSVGGSWEYQGGSAGNSLTYWTCSSATETVQSNSIGYCQFTYNGPQRGTVCIRLVF